MKKDEVHQDMIDFHEAFVDALDEFIMQSVEAGEEGFNLKASDAFSMMASRMMFLIVRGVIKGGVTKQSFLKTMEDVYDITNLTFSKPEGGIQ